MAAEPQFDPRRAALQYAANVEKGARAQGGAALLSDTAQAVVCGLVYIGDQIRGLSDVTDEPDRVTLGDLNEQLKDIGSALLGDGGG